MVFSRKAAIAVAGLVSVSIGGAYAQTAQEAATAKKAQALGLSTSTLNSLTAAEKKTLTRLFNRMTTAEKNAVTKLLRASSRPMGGSSMGSGTMNNGSTGTTPTNPTTPTTP